MLPIASACLGCDERPFRCELIEDRAIGHVRLYERVEGGFVEAGGSSFAVSGAIEGRDSGTDAARQRASEQLHRRVVL